METYTKGTLGKISVYILDLKAKHGNVAYERVRIWVGQKNHLAFKEEDYSLSGKLMRTILAPKWAKIGGHYVWKKVMFRDELKKGNKTILNLEKVSIKPLPDALFTKAYLEKASR